MTIKRFAAAPVLTGRSMMVYEVEVNENPT
jgi:hypothetical protein